VGFHPPSQNRISKHLSQSYMEVESLSTFDFTRLSDKGQLEILLGKRTGNPIVDLRIDSAIRQFLRHTRKQSGIADN